MSLHQDGLRMIIVFGHVKEDPLAVVDMMLQDHTNAYVVFYLEILEPPTYRGLQNMLFFGN